MATKMNMLKLLQEVRGFAQFSQLPSEPRPAGPLLLPFRFSRKSAAKRKQAIKIRMLEQLDIPHPVPITYLDKTR